MNNVVIGGVQLDEDEKYLAKLEAGLYTLQVSHNLNNELLGPFVFLPSSLQLTLDIPTCTHGNILQICHLISQSNLSTCSPLAFLLIIWWCLCSCLLLLWDIYGRQSTYSMSSIYNFSLYYA
jgi:hypothetical protein